MRLIDADALKSKIREQPWKQETKVSLILEWIYTLIDEASTVQNEALRQENEQLKDENASIRNWNACEEKLHNELLESDKRRWELESELEDANNYREGLEAIVDKLREQVKTYVEAKIQDYHNPADVEALRKARNLLQRYKDHIKSYPCECKFGLDFYGNKTPFRDGEMCERCAELAEIEAIGGKEGAE